MTTLLPRGGRRPRLAAPACACALALAGSLATTAAPALSARLVGSRIDVNVGQDFFTSYRFAADEKYPFLFPVNAPSGASVTSLRNGRYPHHSSLFLGCDKVNGGNYWQEGLEAGQIVSDGAVLVRAAGDTVVIADACTWRRPGAEPPFRDTRRISLTAPDASRRQIDVEIELEALQPVTIGKTNHSLFSLRLAPDLAPTWGGVLVNADGARGERGTFGHRSVWLAAWAERTAGVTEGVVLVQHPENTWGRAPWFTRDYGFLSPTPLYWPDGDATRLARGERVRLRYRVIVFAGAPAEATLAGWAAEFTGTAGAAR